MTFTDYADYERELHRRQRITARKAIEMMAAVIGEDGQDRDELLEYAAWVLLDRLRHHASVIYYRGNTYRLKDRLKGV